MLATVKEIQFNVERGKFRMTKLVVATDKGEDKEYFIFTNAKFHNTVATLRPGDNIEIKMEKNGKYWNVGDVTLASKGEVPTSGGKQSGGSVRQQESPNKDTSIARAVALKAGVDLYCSMITAGLVKKTLKPDVAVEEVFAITKRFEGYTTLAEDIESLSADGSAIKAGADDFEEAPFPE